MSITNLARQSRAWKIAMDAVRPAGRFIPHKIYRSLWARGPFEARLAGGRFQLFHDGSELANDVYWRNEWFAERLAVAEFAKLITSAEVFIDVGANLGIYTLLAKSLNPSLNVIALEPSPDAFRALCANLALNNLHIIALQAAATSQSGQMILYDLPGRSAESSLENNWRPNAVARNVDAVCLDDIAEERNIFGKSTLVKIDVEGHEVSVLRGASRLIAANPSAIFLVEVLRQQSAIDVAECLRPSAFHFLFANEASGELEDRTSDFAKHIRPPKGNYFIMPHG